MHLLSQMQHLNLLATEKKTCWEEWKFFPSATRAFWSPVYNPFVPQNLESIDFKVINQYCSVFYDKHTIIDNLNDSQKDLFPRRVQMMQNLLPILPVLLQHVNRYNLIKSYLSCKWFLLGQKRKRVVTFLDRASRCV